MSICRWREETAVDWLRADRLAQPGVCGRAHLRAGQLPGAAGAHCNRTFVEAAEKGLVTFAPVNTFEVFHNLITHVARLRDPQVMQTLKDLASEGKTVVCSIHQPRSSIFEMFDDLLLVISSMSWCRMQR